MTFVMAVGHDIQIAVRQIWTSVAGAGESA